jgi:hypothetical protein
MRLLKLSSLTVPEKKHHRAPPAQMKELSAPEMLNDATDQRNHEYHCPHAAATMRTPTPMNFHLGNPRALRLRSELVTDANSKM